MVVEKVLSEMTILEQLDHPFIATLWFTFGDDTHIYMLSEFLAGGDLRRNLNQRGRFSESRAKLYLCELALALEYLRLKAIAHLDVKPENILLDVEGNRRTEPHSPPPKGR
jgi:serine/threonine kinase 32